MDIRKWLSAKKPTKSLPLKEGEDEVGHFSRASTSLSLNDESGGAPANHEAVASSAPSSATVDLVLEQIPQAPDDLGINHPNQVFLKQYPNRFYQGKKRSFVSGWYQNRDWLEYSVKADAAYCFPCRHFGKTARGTIDSAFLVRGYNDWKHAVEKDKGFHRHENSKEHITCQALWYEREKREMQGKEISTLVNADQLGKNRFYVSSLIDVIVFLSENQLPLRGKLDAFDDMSEGGSGLFLSLLDYTIKKDSQLAEISKSIPRNATYTCHSIQNELIGILSSVVTEAIVGEVGNSWYTIKVDGTRDPTGCENISIVIPYVSEENQATERLLTIATASAGDAKTLADTIIAELTKTGLKTSKILSQMYDGTSLMSGSHGGVQKILQEKLEREIPYVHCFNHQLHLVVVHAMSSEESIMDFFSLCNTLYKFFKKPTIAVQYQGVRLKRLLDQRWTGHLATVSVILSSLQDIISLLTKLETVRAHGAEVRVEAVGLLREVTKPSFIFIAHLMRKVLLLLDPPNKLLQGEDTDLLTGMGLVASAIECIRKLRCDETFTDLWNTTTAANKALTTVPPKRRRTLNKNMDQYVVEETVGQGDKDDKLELKRLFFNTLDVVLCEMDERFSERNTQLATALAALDPERDTFLDTDAIKHIMELTHSNMVGAEYAVAKQFLLTQMNKDTQGEKWTITRILKTQQKTLKAMPSVLTAFKLALTFGASTAMCENSFSTLKNVFTDHRRAMLHVRKAQLVQLAFERDLTHKCTNEWKDIILKRFHSDTRRLPLY